MIMAALMKVRNRPLAAAILCAALTVSYACWIFLSSYPEGLEEIVSSFLLITFYVVFVVFSFILYRDQRLELPVRQSWLLLGYASLCSAIAEIIWFLYDSILHRNPFISVADIFFLLTYPLTLAGVLRLPYVSRTREERTTLYLDLAIVLTASFMGLSYFILFPNYFSADKWFEAAIALAYPVGGTLLFSAVVGLIQSTVEKRVWWILFFLGSGIFCNIIADGFMAYFEIHNIPYRLPHLNVLWLTSALCMLAAASWQMQIADLGLSASSSDAPSRRLFGRALPYAATIVGMIVLFFALRSTKHPEEILFETAILIGLVLLRQHIVIRENVRLYKEMERIAITDELTGVYNRHFANETLRLEVQRARRFELPLSILMIDLDGFKRFNDQYGHLKGDDVLRMIARTLATQIRGSDLLARFGGDEFIAILVQTDDTGAKVAAEKIRHAADHLTFQGSRLGISVGVASLKSNLTLEDLIEEADRELYKDKQEKQLLL